MLRRKTGPRVRKGVQNIPPNGTHRTKPPHRTKKTKTPHNHRGGGGGGDLGEAVYWLLFSKLTILGRNDLFGGGGTWMPRENSDGRDGNKAKVAKLKGPGMLTC